MQINNVVNIQNIQRQQNFKGSSANSSPVSSSPNYQSIPLETSKAYASPQITQRYREIETFDVPYVGQGKLYELANGHKIAVIPKKGGSFTINTCVKAGKEQDSVTSHFLEHLVCDTDKKIDNQKVSDYLDDIGGSYQATTHGDYTNYIFNAPIDNKEDVNKLIKIQSQFLQTPNLSLPRIEKEKKILISEDAVTDKGSYNSEAEKINYLMLNQLLNLNEKPEDKSKELTEIEKIKSTNFAQLSTFYNKYYNNNNMFTIIEGDVNPDEVVKTFSRYFNKENKATVKNKPEKQDLSTPIKKTKRIDIQSNSNIEENIQVGFVGPQNNDKKNSFIASALKLYIEDNDSGYEMANFETTDYPTKYSYLRFSTSAEAGKEEDQLKELYQKLFDLTQKTISDEDFNALKLKLKDRYSINTESANVLPDTIAEDFVDNGKIKFFDDYKYIDSISKKDLQDFAKKYIDFNKALVIVAHNKYESKEVHSAQPSFTGRIKDIDTERITEYKYPNNLQLLVDNSEGITRTTYRVNLTSNEIPNVKPGVLEALKDMLEDDFKDSKISKMQCLGFDSDIRLNSIDLSVSVLPEGTNDAIAFVNSKLQNPGLTQEKLDITKEGLKVYYKELTKDKYISIMKQQEYGDYPMEGTLEGISSYDEVSQKIDDIQLSDVIDLYNQIIKNAQGKAILVIPKNTFESQKQSIFEQIGQGFRELQPKQKISIAEKTDIKPIEKTRVMIDETKDNYGGVTQEFKIINNGNLKDNLSLKLLSNILGDNGRLKKDIRQDKGLAYAAGANYDTDGTLGYFSMGAHLSLAKENSDDLITVVDSIKSNVDKVILEPVNENELQHAKNQFKSDIITWIEFSKGRNDLLNEYGIEDAKKLFKIIDEITPQDIQNITKTYLTKPAIISIDANKEVLAANKDYLASRGEIVTCN